MKRRVFITGISGQDGSYLAEQLLAEGCEVHGFLRYTSRQSLPRLAAFQHRLTLHEGDITDGGSIERALKASQPSEIYHLAAQSFVGTSWKQPALTVQTNGVGSLTLYEAVLRVCPHARCVHVGSSEMFGRPRTLPMDEESPTLPVSPAGAAELYGHSIAGVYRNAHSLFISRVIPFNHESPRRSPLFLTRKLSLAAARATTMPDVRVTLGNLDARRDWGWAPDFVQGFVLALRHPEPIDVVLATGQVNSVRNVAEQAFAVAGLDWLKHVHVAEAQGRPAEIPLLQGDCAKARRELGWEPSVDFSDMVRRMVEADLAALRRAQKS